MNEIEEGEANLIKRISLLFFSSQIQFIYREGENGKGR